MRVIPVLLVLLSLAFMHGACMTHDGAAHAGIGAHAGAASADGAGHVHPPEVEGHQHDHGPDHDPCCTYAPEAAPAALLTVMALLLLVALGAVGRGLIQDGALQRALAGLCPRRGRPPRVSPRHALCVLRL
ncbi:hypothetical protein GCM10010191_49260 [Actinomadura vinacea]|uniref:DUF2946 domain-containing protein n=1 Tax=Actinomadura vinacea TaxID=115336 RepID=A0ABP5WQ67_9ACTN